MRFVCDGQKYDTAEMSAYDTPLPRTPTVYVSPCGTAVFVMTMDVTHGIVFHRAGEAEVRFLAATCQLPQLLAFVPPPPPPPPEHVTADGDGVNGPSVQV